MVFILVGAGRCPWTCLPAHNLHAYHRHNAHGSEGIHSSRELYQGEFECVIVSYVTQFEVRYY
jgi:hypothetical protein